jgi:hypothetical protein
MYTHKTQHSRENGRPKLNWSKKDHECSPVEQSHKDSCDIKNKILAFMQEPPVPTELPKEGIDLTTIPDAIQAAQIVAEGKQAWEMIPPRIRAEFGNNQENFLAAALDPDQRQNLLDMGFDASYLPVKEIPSDSPSPSANAQSGASEEASLSDSDE